MLFYLFAACTPSKESTHTQIRVVEQPTVPTERPSVETITHFAAQPSATPSHDLPIINKLPATAVIQPTQTPSNTPTPTAEEIRYQLPIAGQMQVDWIISNYVDHNLQAYQSVDYNNGTMTYDGHSGTDFLLQDLAQMDAGVSILAARAGIVIDIQDPANDGEWMGSETNYIIIEHADGSRATYQHLRQHSASVAIGDSVAVGQPIALVGNSGNSANPHLHFEVQTANGRIIDIFKEGLSAFHYPYPHKPFVFQAGVTHLADPYLQNDMFRYTPATLSLLHTNDTPAFWYKAVNIQRQDRLHSILVYPDGRQQELFTIAPTQDAPIAYWYIYTDSLAVGWYSVWYSFNDGLEGTGSLSFQVVP
ncbi:MAG: M23 family metallopeptidase [Chloroflexi bacterium]|nr:M23 family metallopeptidase [Chloroflexota bacterium]